MIRWHEVKRKLGNLWKLRWLRVTVVISVVAGAIILVFALSQLPQAVDVEKKKHSPSTSQAEKQQTVLLEPVASSDGLFFSFQGKPNETIELYSDKARF